MRWFLSLIGNLIALTAAFGLLARYVPPQVFWPPAIIALLLPGLLVLTAIYALFALSRRHWPGAMLPIAVILFSIPVLDQLFAWPGGDERDGAVGPTVTFVTGNQRLFRSYDGKDVDHNRVADAFRSFNPDVALLQEVRPAKNRMNYISSIQAAERLDQRHQKEGTLVATYAGSVQPVTSSFTEPNEYNGYIVTDVETALGTVRVINAHLESNQISGLADNIQEDGSYSNRLETFGHMLTGYGRTSRLRAQQAEDIRTAVETSPYPVVLGGDFNDVPSSYTYNQILSPRLKDAWVARGRGLGTTFTGPLPGLRIDYFLVDTSLSVVSIERLSPNWSDHRPLRMVISR
ncbi:endonuclease/exonuclease/phosphatase family metal-dependent hydrolase [Lewinella marina]|uniref:endonuclease/exonuclease/phosphatase family protein n=1 Tax=Neolewinella marina TaxID=438751 RepID=UPI00117A90DA|nr:endonuclease/exonuclease/phosphatase family protein [Neolewinella marina]NJB86207.1 endonuclease/exonuclease/phosphatase family metal-dependent hydrolase [Neolewinella marina]